MSADLPHPGGPVTISRPRPLLLGQSRNVARPFSRPTKSTPISPRSKAESPDAAACPIGSSPASAARRSSAYSSSAVVRGPIGGQTSVSRRGLSPTVRNVDLAAGAEPLLDQQTETLKGDFGVVRREPQSGAVAVDPVEHLPEPTQVPIAAGVSRSDEQQALGPVPGVQMLVHQVDVSPCPACLDDHDRPRATDLPVPGLPDQVIGERGRTELVVHLGQPVRPRLAGHVQGALVLAREAVSDPQQHRVAAGPLLPVPEPDGRGGVVARTGFPEHRPGTEVRQRVGDRLGFRFSTGHRQPGPVGLEHDRDEIELSRIRLRHQASRSGPIMISCLTGSRPADAWMRSKPGSGNRTSNTSPEPSSSTCGVRYIVRAPVATGLDDDAHAMGILVDVDADGRTLLRVRGDRCAEFESVGARLAECLPVLDVDEHPGEDVEHLLGAGEGRVLLRHIARRDAADLAAGGETVPSPR